MQILVQLEGSYNQSHELFFFDNIIWHLYNIIGHPNFIMRHSSNVMELGNPQHVSAHQRVFSGFLFDSIKAGC